MDPNINSEGDFYDLFTGMPLDLTKDQPTLVASTGAQDSSSVWGSGLLNVFSDLSKTVRTAYGQWSGPTAATATATPLPAWFWPVAIGAGALLLVVALLRR